MIMLYNTSRMVARKFVVTTKIIAQKVATNILTDGQFENQNLKLLKVANDGTIIEESLSGRGRR